MMLPPHPTPPSAFCSCPACHRRLPLRALFLPTNSLRRYTCPTCSAALTLSQSRPSGFLNLALSLIAFIVFLFSLFVQYSHLPSVFFALIFATTFLALFTDRVSLDPLANPTRCPRCAYDLTGTLAAHLPRCPECGHNPLPPAPNS